MLIWALLRCSCREWVELGDAFETLCDGCTSVGLGGGDCEGGHGEDVECGFGDVILSGDK